MDFLKDVLGPELYAQVEERLKDTKINLADLSKGEYVGKGKYDAVAAQLAAAQATISERDGQLETLRKTDPEKLQAEITRLKGENAAAAQKAQAELDALKMEHAINQRLIEAKARNAKALKGLLDMAQIKMDGDSIQGLDNQLEALRKSDGYLFGDTESAPPPGSGFLPPAGGSPMKKTWKEMTLAEQTALFRAKPDDAARLAAAAGITLIP